jgi:hypothetical protein
MFLKIRIFFEEKIPGGISEKSGGCREEKNESNESPQHCRMFLKLHDDIPFLMGTGKASVQ